MEFLRIFLLITGLFEIGMLYKLYLLKDVATHIEIGFMKGEISTEGTLFLYGFLLTTLLILRLHLVIDMTNKNLYRVVFWIHFLEAVILVGIPFLKGNLVTSHPVSYIIALTPVWMASSYKSYLYPKKQHQN